MSYEQFIDRFSTFSYVVVPIILWWQVLFRFKRERFRSRYIFVIGITLMAIVHFLELGYFGMSARSLDFMRFVILAVVVWGIWKVYITHKTKQSKN